MATSLILKTAAPILASIALEHFQLRWIFASLYQSSSIVPGISRIYGLVIAVNVISTAVVLLILGTKVGQSRNKFIEKANKDGDKDAEDRFSYPKMYAEGFSKHAKQFNCIQRSHQHALETYTQFVALSLVSGLLYPLVTTIAGALWVYARLQWALGYQSGEPKKRYEHWSAYGIWTSLLIVLFGSITSAVLIIIK